MNGDLPFDSRPMSFYLHIPFCRQTCSFCEYTRMKSPSEEVQNRYIDILERDIVRFVSVHGTPVLAGCDIGGGTPSVLNDNGFLRLMDIYRYILGNTRQTDDFEPSIEATFQTLDDRKIRMIAEAGIGRVSIGIQSASSKVLGIYKRSTTPLKEMVATVENALAAGIQKVNIDLMYGLKSQTPDSVEADIDTIRAINPQQVTLYELRTNIIAHNPTMGKEDLYSLYCRYFEALLGMGYHAKFGQNTFSRDCRDEGLSSYLRHRMIDGTDYRGFGVSAQSMSPYGISYNIHKMKRLRESDFNVPSFDSYTYYRLPRHELASKYIAISAYYGEFSLAHLSAILGEDANIRYRDAIEYCLNNNLVTQSGDIIRITREGFKYYGAVFSLFYHPLMGE